MRQKVTWIIPGILVTLLLGLLWAIPASAATDAGNIEFLDSAGEDEISYLSLKGLGGPGQAVMLSVTDQDLNKPTSYLGTKAILVDTIDQYDWTDLADRNGDGDRNYKDFSAFTLPLNTALEDSTAPGTAEGTARVPVTIDRQDMDLDVTNGGLTYDGDAQGGANDEVATHLEFQLYELDTISGRAATTEERSDRRVDAAPSSDAIGGAPGQGPLEVGAPAEAVSDMLSPDDDGEGNAENWTWRNILDTNGDGKIDAKDTGITRQTGNADLRSANQGTPGNDFGVIAASAIKARNTGAVAAEPDLVIEFEVTTPFRAAEGADTVTTDDDVAQVSEEVTLRIYGIPGVEENPDTDTIELFVAVDVGIDVTLTYTTPIAAIGKFNDKGAPTNQVTVSSDAFAGGMGVILTETAANSGEFTARLMICEFGTSGCEAGQADKDATSDVTDGEGMVTIPVNVAGDTIRVTYSDSAPSRTRTASIPLDIDGPSFSNLAPASGTSGREDEPTVSFDVADTDSGISDDKDAENSVKVIAGLYRLNDDRDDTVIYYRDDLKLEEAINGYSASVTIEEGLASDELDADEAGDEYEVRWWAVSTDLAGNIGVSDSDSDTACAVPASANDDNPTTAIDAILALFVKEVKNEDGEVTTKGVGCDPFVVRVDTAGPELDATKTFTGTWLDGSEEQSGSDGKRTSIVAGFNEALDCDSVSADDFEVDGSAPNAVTCKGSNVYLDVDELDPNDRPDIAVGNESLTDKAGNLIGEDEEVTANDGIPAKLTVTVTGTGEGDRVVTDEDITITISSDERLAGNPTVVISKVGDDHVLNPDPVATASPTGNVNEWELKPVFGLADDDGLWSVYVSGNDLGSGALKLKASAGTAGVEGTEKDDDGKDVGNEEFTIDLDSKSAILFEVDNEVQGPAWSPDIVDNDYKTDNANVFIRADFSDEGKEYGLDGVDADATPVDDTRKETDTPDDVDTDFDTHATVTLISASFNGDDVTEDVNTRDWIRYAYRPGALTNGDHVFKIEVMDSAGNEKEFTLEFAKTDREPYTLEIDPGPNLISFPANPVDGDINAVFGGEGNEDITNVLTYDNASGLWMSALKGEDGMFVGDLTTIDAMHGYWVLSDGVLDVSVVLEGGERFDRTPPHLAVQEGWNLVSVVDADQSKAGTGIPTNEYFANIDAQVVYGFDSLAGRLVRLSTAKADATKDEVQDMVETGSAYWVYANEAGIIIP